MYKISIPPSPELGIVGGLSNEGPWNTYEEAYSFLRSECGAPGAKVVQLGHFETQLAKASETEEPDWSEHHETDQRIQNTETVLPLVRHGGSSMSNIKGRWFLLAAVLIYVGIWVLA
jgi:hypothetical protein